MLKIALLTLGDPDTPSGGYLYHRRMASMARNYGARIQFVSYSELPFPLPASQTPALLREVLRLEAHVLVLDSIAAPYFGAWCLLQRSGRRHNELPLPLIGMLHQPPGGIDHGRLPTWVQARLDLEAYRRARRLLVASDALLEEVAAAGVPRARLEVVPPGRDVAATVGAAVPDMRQGRRASLLCVAHWLERKGVHSLLDALSQLPADAAMLHLAGDTTADRRYAGRLRSRLEKPDLRDRVVIHGHLSPENVAALYAAADVFVLPSVKEPFGTVYGEAMAFGLPVVGWRAGNLPYLARNGEEGLLLEPGDVDGLARALQRLIDDAGFRSQLSESARRRAETRPTWEESATLFFASIREVVEAGAA